MVPGQKALQSITKQIRLDLGQIAETTEIDSHHRNASRKSELDRAEHGPVSSETYHQIQARRKRCSGDHLGPMSGRHQPLQVLLSQALSVRAAGIEHEGET